jgi:integrase
VSTSLPKFKIKTVVWASGERFSMIVDPNTRMPLVDPTVFAMVEMRRNGSAHSTIKQAMGAIRILVSFLISRQIDIAYRIHKEGKLFEINEVEQLISLCKLSQSEIDVRLGCALTEAKSISILKNLSSVRSIQRFRMRSGRSLPQTVQRGTVNIRLTYIEKYLQWLTSRELVRADSSDSFYVLTQSKVAAALGALAAKRIHKGSRKSKMKRRGLPVEVIKRLHEVLDPSSPENPWRPGFNRYRNRLYIYWLLDVALRRGELLALKTEDISFSTKKAEIVRRPDNPDDPRTDAPLVKGQERTLNINTALLAYTEEYLEMRRKFVTARRHGYLFVSSREGAELSQSAARDIFYALRRKVSGLPFNLSAHVFRHTWNTLFTNHAFETNMSEKTREDLMKNQNGWSDKSKMPNYYSVTAIEMKSQEESLKIQNKIHGMKKKLK